MAIPFKPLSSLAVLSSAILFCTPLMAQSVNPAWTDDLENQLLLDEDCRVVKYETIHEGKLAGRAMYNATVVCEDGRRLDAHLIEPDEDFTIRICEIVRC